MLSSAGPQDLQKRPSSELVRTRASFRDLSRVPRAVTRAYSINEISQDLRSLGNAMDSTQSLMQRHVAFYGSCTGLPAPDYLYVSYGTPDGTIHRESYRQSDIYLEATETGLEQRHLSHPDNMIEALNAAPGNTLISDDRQVADTPAWLRHRNTVLAPLGIGHVAAIRYRVPVQASRMLEVSYGFADGVAPDELAHRFVFDVLTLPFAIHWLARFDGIDQGTAQYWLFLLEGLTPAKLFLIREIVCMPRYNPSELIERAGLSKRTIDNHLYQISDLLNDKVPRGPNGEGYGSILVDITRTFGFLAYFGRPIF